MLENTGCGTSDCSARCLHSSGAQAITHQHIAFQSNHACPAAHRIEDLGPLTAVQYLVRSVWALSNRQCILSHQRFTEKGTRRTQRHIAATLYHYRLALQTPARFTFRAPTAWPEEGTSRQSSAPGSGSSCSTAGCRCQRCIILSRTTGLHLLPLRPTSQTPSLPQQACTFASYPRAPRESRLGKSRCHITWWQQHPERACVQQRGPRV